MADNSFLGVYFVLFILVIGMVWFQTYQRDKEHKEIMKTGQICNGFYSFDKEYDCCVSCVKMDMQYLRYESSSEGLFKAGYENCFCLVNQTTKQIY